MKKIDLINAYINRHGYAISCRYSSKNTVCKLSTSSSFPRPPSPPSKFILCFEIGLCPEYMTRIITWLWPRGRNYRLYTVPKFKVRNVPNFKVWNVPNFKVRNVPNFKVRNIPNLKVGNITIYNSGQSFTSFRLLKPTIKHD